jgi:hypothetical protein
MKMNTHNTTTMLFKAYRYALEVVCTKHIALVRGRCRFSNFVWEASDMRSLSYVYAMCKVYQHDTTQVNNSSNSECEITCYVTCSRAKCT